MLYYVPVVASKIIKLDYAYTFTPQFSESSSIIYVIEVKKPVMLVMTGKLILTQTQSFMGTIWIFTVKRLVTFFKHGGKLYEESLGLPHIFVALDNGVL